MASYTLTHPDLMGVAVKIRNLDEASHNIQARLREKNRPYVEPKEAEAWLEEAGLIDVSSPPGRNLRMDLRRLRDTRQLHRLQGAERVDDPSDERVKWRIFQV